MVRSYEMTDYIQNDNSILLTLEQVQLYILEKWQP